MRLQRDNDPCRYWLRGLRCEVHPSHPVNPPSARLTPDDVIGIEGDLMDGDSYDVIARRYDIPKSKVSEIKLRMNSRAVLPSEASLRGKR